MLPRGRRALYRAVYSGTHKCGHFCVLNFQGFEHLKVSFLGPRDSVLFIEQGVLISGSLHLGCTRH